MPLKAQETSPFGLEMQGTQGEIYDYEERLKRSRRIIASSGSNGETALRLLDHLFSLKLSVERVSKSATDLHKEWFRSRDFPTLIRGI